jgi:hypothetical protein
MNGEGDSHHATDFKRTNDTYSPTAHQSFKGLLISSLAIEERVLDIENAMPTKLSEKLREKVLRQEQRPRASAKH